MKYFIDFEAMQFSNEIISVGASAKTANSFIHSFSRKRLKK